MDYDGFYPEVDGVAGFERLREGDYLNDWRIYRCPSVRRDRPRGEYGEPLTEEGVDYVYVGGARSDSPSKTVVAHDKPGNHENYGSVLYADGRAKGIKGKNWMEKSGPRRR